MDCLSLFMCPLLAQLIIGFFSSFSAVAIYSTNETNKAGLKQSIIFRCLWFTCWSGACTIKNYGSVIYGLRSKLVCLFFQVRVYLSEPKSLAYYEI